MPSNGRKVIYRNTVPIMTFLILFAVAATPSSTLAAKAVLESTLEVPLSIQEPSGVDRVEDPVTSGIPLPKGSQKDTDGLLLIDKATNRSIPCQYTVLSRWPDGSIKWLLLDFFCTVKASQKAEYLLVDHLPKIDAAKRQHAPEIATSITIKDAANEIRVDTGPLRFSISKKKGTLIRAASINEKPIISEDRPCEAVLKLENGSVYRTALGKPILCEIEDRGPMRARIRVQGKFLDEKGRPLFKGKVAYDLRVTAYAGKPYLKLAFTFENSGRIHSKKKDWLYLKSLKLDVPIVSSLAEDLSLTVSNCSGNYPAASGKPIVLSQWLKYPLVDRRGEYNARSKLDPVREERANAQEKYSGFYYLVEQGETVLGRGERAEGWSAIGGDSSPGVAAFVRHFWQNYPKAIAAAPDRLSIHLWPEEGFWPKTDSAAQRISYQFEGNRFKTTELFLALGEFRQKHGAFQKMIDQPLAARASLDWYRNTGAVWPLASRDVQPAEAQSDQREAVARFDKLQLAKVFRECGEPAGVVSAARGMNIEIEPDWDRVSILSLREECPDIFLGSMNFGDLVWSFGYCSLFYDWPYGMLIQYLRFDQREMLDIGEDMVRHRADIDRGQGWQRYEKGHHGNLERIRRSKYRNRGGFRPHASHTWNRGLLLYWALTGDPRAREAAEENGKAYYHILDKHKNADVDMREFRVPTWALEACLAMYEYTGSERYLEKANEVFTRTLLSMEKKRGSQGHIVDGGKQQAQFTGFLVEPIARLHHVTERKDVLDFLSRVLDWQRKNGVYDGIETGGKYKCLKFVQNWDLHREGKDPGAGIAYGFMFADGYAYLYSKTGRAEDWDFARKVFRDTVFFYGLPGEVEPNERTPLGYHLDGLPFGMCAKLHAWSTRYHQIYLETEERLSQEQGNVR